VKCNKCNWIGDEVVICKANIQQVVADVENAQEDEDQLFVATCFSSSNSSESWLIDSGCTNHMTYDSFMCLDDTEVKIGNGEQISVKGKGSVAITSYTGTKTASLMFYMYLKLIETCLVLDSCLRKGSNLSLKIRTA